MCWCRAVQALQMSMRLSEPGRNKKLVFFWGSADHSVLLSSLFFSVMSVYTMDCNLYVMDVHGLFL